MRISKKYLATILASGMAGCVALTGLNATANAQALQSAVSELKSAATVDFEKFADTKPGGKQANEAEMTAFFGALGDLFVFSAEAIEQDGKGAVARNAKLAFAGSPDLGMQFSELRLWGANPSKRTVGRIDAKDATYFGFKELSNEISSKVTGAIVDEVVGDVEGVDAADLSMTVEKYDLKLGRLVLDGAKFYEWPEGLSLKAAAETNEVSNVLKLIGTAGRMMSAETGAFYDMNGEMAYSQLEQKTTASFSAALGGFSGADRGNIDYNFIKDTKMKMALPIPSEDGETFQTMEMDYEYGAMTFADMRLDKMLEFFSRGEVPDTSVTDLLSLGVWTIEGEKQSLNGQVISSIEKSVTDLSSFHWFIPTSIESTFKGGTIGVGAFMDFVKTAVPAGEVDEEMFTAIAKSLADNGLSTIRYDGNFSSTWDEEKGGLTLKTDADLAELGSFSLVTDGVMPTYEEIAPMIPLNGNTFDQNAFNALFMQKSGLDNFELSMTDAGGLDRTFAVASALAKVIPNDDPTVAAMAEMSPAELRQMASGTIRVSALALTQVFPPAMSYVNSYASFIDEGGTIKAMLKPSKRLDFQAIGEAAQLQADPSALEEFLGISVVHDKP